MGDMASRGKKARKRAQKRAGDGWRCHYCHKHFGKKSRTGAKCTIDHVIPRALGGPGAAWNTVIACPTCNHNKGNMTYERFTGSPTLPRQCWEWAHTTAEYLQRRGLAA